MQITICISQILDNVIRKVNASNGLISTIAGSGVAGFSGDGNFATSGQFNAPWSIAISGDGSFYIADFYNNRVRKIDSTGMLSTMAGNGNAGYSGDGGYATVASLNSPASIAIDRQAISTSRTQRITVSGK
jgi:hypothetical protein